MAGLNKVFRRPMFIWCGIVAVCSVLLNSLRVLAEWIVVSPRGTDELLWTAEMNLFFLFLLALAVVPVSVILLIFRKTRKTALYGLSAGVIYLFIAIAAPLISDQVRMRGFYKLAERSTVLVQAIHRFEKEKGAPPKTLQELVPEYLNLIPITGMGGYPTYEYKTGREAHQWTDDSWLLYVNTPAGGINFDIFIYLPSRNYQKDNLRYDGCSKLIGEWAYIYE
jgi:hypothetical protein